MAGKKRKGKNATGGSEAAPSGEALDTPVAADEEDGSAVPPPATAGTPDEIGEAAATALAIEEAAVAGEPAQAPSQIVGWAPIQQHMAAGKGARKMVPRTSHAGWVPPHDRPDPVALLQTQDATRVPELVPIRWGRMSVSPFTFYRGAALTMASDLASTPNSGLTVQACGDAHLLNFGVFASPERTLLFDVNDFDETLPGPWEWDLKRLTASVVVAGRAGGFTREQNRDATLAAARSYREWMGRFAEMGDLDVYYSKVAAEEVLELAKTARGVRGKSAAQILAKARTHDSLQALSKLTETVDGMPRIIDAPPLIAHLDPGQIDLERVTKRAFADYRKTLQEDHREIINRYQFVDMAMKVVGVGSVGTLALIALLLGRDDGDPLFLQLKQAGPSVLEPYIGKSRYQNHAHRVVAGQRLMQAASDIFLGWIRATGPQHRDFYWRQLRDMKGSMETEGVRPAGLALYAGICAWTLARGHARSGDRIAIAAYLGKSDRFDLALADFAEAYADQTERDFEVVTKAIKQGRVQVETGV
jgi:uncharacterized protein (DUF2252 family)